jgi:hypothetical protein
MGMKLTLSLLTARISSEALKTSAIYDLSQPSID